MAEIELTPEQIAKLKAATKAQRENLEKLARETKENAEKYACTVFCCNSTSCRSAGGESVLDAFQSAVATNELQDKVRVVKTGCMGLCSAGPLVRVEIKGQKPVMYKKIDAMTARLIVVEHIEKALNEGEAFKLSPTLAELIPHYLFDSPSMVNSSAWEKRRSDILKPKICITSSLVKFDTAIVGSSSQ